MTCILSEAGQIYTPVSFLSVRFIKSFVIIVLSLRVISLIAAVPPDEAALDTQSTRSLLPDVVFITSLRTKLNCSLSTLLNSQRGSEIKF